MFIESFWKIPFHLHWNNSFFLPTSFIGKCNKLKCRTRVTNTTGVNRCGNQLSSFLVRRQLSWWEVAQRTGAVLWQSWACTESTVGLVRHRQRPKHDTSKLIQEAETGSQAQRADLEAPSGGRWRRDGWGAWSRRWKLFYVGWINDKVWLYNTGICIQYPVISHKGKKIKEDIENLKRWLMLKWLFKNLIIFQLIKQ